MSAKPITVHWSRHLIRPVFLLFLALLLLNDHVLKAEFGNWWTGKISDVAGLFVFPFFWAALFPRQWKGIHIATLIGFIWWKSPYSEGFLEFMGALGWSMDRTVDFSDLLALPMIVLSAFLFRRPPPIRPKASFQAVPIVLVSLFAFVATTPPRMVLSTVDQQNVDYKFDFPFDTLTYRLSILSDDFVEKEDWVELDSTNYHWYIDPSIPDTLGEVIDPLRVKSGDTVRLFSQYARVVLEADGTGSSMKVLQTGALVSSRVKEKDRRKSTLRKFETDIVESLREMDEE